MCFFKIITGLYIMTKILWLQYYFMSTSYYNSTYNGMEEEGPIY